MCAPSRPMERTHSEFFILRPAATYGGRPEGAAPCVLAAVSYGVTVTLIIAVVQQQTSPPPPNPE
jgi:hypothetical protein